MAGNVIGNNSSGGFITSPSAAKVAIASKFTANATFTPIKMGVFFGEQLGNAGTCYVAVYSDNAGAVNAMLFSGSASYAGTFTGELDIAVTGTQLTNGTAYWLAAYFVQSSGGFNIQADVSSGGSSVNWTEPTAGSWTNTPTTGTQDSSHAVDIYGTDLLTFSVSDASTVTNVLTQALEIDTVNVNDSSAATENVNVAMPPLAVNVSDSSAVTENIIVQDFYPVVVEFPPIYGHVKIIG